MESADQRPQIAADPHLHPEPARGTGWKPDLFDLSGVDSRDTHLGAGIERRDLLELGIEAETVGEQHPPVADEEQARGEQQQPPITKRPTAASRLFAITSIRNAATT